MTEAPLISVHMERDRFDPIPELLKLRTESTLPRVELPWGPVCRLVTRYEDVRTVLGDATRFSNSSSAGMGGPVEPGFIVGYDPPDHTRLRRLLTAEFTVRRIKRLQPRIEAIVAQHLDAMAEAGPPVDLVQAFALPIPSLVICELLGVPYSDRAEFQRRGGARIDVSIDHAARMKAIAENREYLAGLVAEQRVNPGDDMLGMLVRDHGDAVTDAELTGIADIMLLAGHETTSNMLGLGTLLLLRNPDQLAMVRDGGNVDQAVEEMLRYLSIVHSVLVRQAREDVVLSGELIEAGELLMCSVPAANRDPALGSDVDRFDITKKVAAHLAFGHGVHHCIGAPLARMEMRIAYPALLQRFPTLRLAIPFDEVPFRVFSAVYGVESLPVAW